MRRHEHRFSARTLVFYGAVLALVVVVATVAIWSFVDRQRLRRTIAAEPLPPVTVVTQDPDSPLATSWVELLTAAGFPATLVPVDKFTAPDKGVILLAGLETMPAPLADGVRRQLTGGGGVAVVGSAPGNGAELLGLATTEGISGPALRLSETASPVLARAQPGYELGSARRPVALLDESPEMKVDARWAGTSRAAIVHFRTGGGRVLWFGFDPTLLWDPTVPQLSLVLRTAFRWLASQPVSEAAVGLPAAARSLTPPARMEARRARLGFSVDRLHEEGSFSLRVRNGSREPVANPTVKVWMPENVSRLEPAGSWMAKRGVTVSPVEDEHALLVALPPLRAHEDRMLRLEGELRVDRSQ